MTTTNFQQDLKKGHKGEQVVYKVMAAQCQNYDYYMCANNPQYYHRGDIMAVRKTTQQKVFIEVKTDTCIGRTGNILCEEKQYFNGYTKPGFMYSDYEIMAILNEASRTIYLINFQVLKQHYKEGIPRYLCYTNQASDVFLYPLGKLAKNGGIIKTIHY